MAVKKFATRRKWQFACLTIDDQIDVKCIMLVY